jgi:hypothetical protein
MAQEMYFKRAKIFMRNHDDGEQRYVSSVNANGTTTKNVPDWVLETPTYKMGVKDKSIINLTPPKAAVAPEEAEAAAEEPENEEEAAVELIPDGFDAEQPLANGRAAKKTAKKK